MANGSTNSKKKKNIKRKVPNMKNIKPPNSIFGNVFFYIFLALLLALLFTSSPDPWNQKENVSISEVVELIDEGKVQDIVVSRDDIDILLQDGTQYSSKKETGVSFDEFLKNNEVDRTKIAGEIKVEDRFRFEDLLGPLVTIGFPLLILYIIFRQMRAASGDVMQFGMSRAKRFDGKAQKVKFDDVAGVKNAKDELVEVVDFLKNPEKYRKLGARIPRGILLVGPAGVGKTLLAKAVAGEAGVPFFSVAGSEFMEMLVGVGSSRARDLFAKAKASQPALIFIDEIDAIGRQRGMGIGGGHDEREQTLNQILIEMDGFDPRSAVIVLAATNRPDMLDPALIRPGRFDRRVTLTLPDLEDRIEIIKIHMKGKPFIENLDIKKIAKRTVGFSGADLENMLNEAAIQAARENKTKIDYNDIEEASLKVSIGPERKIMQTEEEREMTAYHEAGHALVSSFVPDMDPVHSITIIARGGSLGHTSFPPDRDRYNQTETRLRSMIATTLGGRAAEELVYNELTVGASNDIQQATKIARAMVTEYGMSPLGPINFNGHHERAWFAKELQEGPSYSEDMSAKIDAEVKKIIDNAYKTAFDILKKYKPTLDKIAKELVEKETVPSEEYAEILVNDGIISREDLKTFESLGK